MDVPLRLLRWAVHATAGGLLAMAVITMLREERAAVAAAGALLGLVYAAAPAFRRREGSGYVRLAHVWLGLVTAGWAVLAVAAAPFVWLAFPLLFAYLRVLPLWAAMFGVTVLTSSAIIAAAWHAGELTMPLLVGPGVAAVVVTLLALACEAMSTAHERPS
ncbi:hypothetical protein GCM10009733_031440 [Nonomuraea maheshkhaliensis]|uniref:Sensor histidine kinase n=2 Tax=Nonomuraea maheshkhaliensis TaxID=419590 RepID=A0ABN2F7J9_9ACTN